MRTFKNFLSSLQVDASFFFSKSSKEICVSLNHEYESTKPGGYQVREVVVTGVGHFDMESPHVCFINIARNFF